MSETNKLEQVVPVKKFVLPEISSKVKSWELPEDFATFLQERCQSYIHEKELEEFVTTPASCAKYHQNCYQTGPFYQDTG